MGTDAKWICSTCETTWDVNGSRDLNGHPLDPKYSDWRVLMRFVVDGINLVYPYGRLTTDYWHCLSFLLTLARWLRKHEGHDILATNDGTFFPDTTDYKREDFQFTRIYKDEEEILKDYDCNKRFKARDKILKELEE